MPVALGAPGAGGGQQQNAENKEAANGPDAKAPKGQGKDQGHASAADKGAGPGESKGNPTPAKSEAKEGGSNKQGTSATKGDSGSDRKADFRAKPNSLAYVPAGSAEPYQPHSSTELIEAQQGRTADAPLCLTCGTKMRPAGSCYVCEGCGATSGCS